MRPSRRHLSARLARLFVLPPFWPQMLPGLLEWLSPPFSYLFPNRLRTEPRTLNLPVSLLADRALKTFNRDGTDCGSYWVSGAGFGGKQREGGADGRHGLVRTRSAPISKVL